MIMSVQTGDWLVETMGITISLISDINHCDCLSGSAHDYIIVPRESGMIPNYHNMPWTDSDAPEHGHNTVLADDEQHG